MKTKAVTKSIERHQRKKSVEQPIVKLNRALKSLGKPSFAEVRLPANSIRAFDRFVNEARVEAGYCTSAGNPWRHSTASYVISHNALYRPWRCLRAELCEGRSRALTSLYRLMCKNLRYACDADLSGWSMSILEGWFLSETVDEGITADTAAKNVTLAAVDSKPRSPGGFTVCVDATYCFEKLPK